MLRISLASWFKHACNFSLLFAFASLSRKEEVAKKERAEEADLATQHLALNEPQPQLRRDAITPPLWGLRGL